MLLILIGLNLIFNNFDCLYHLPKGHQSPLNPSSICSLALVDIYVTNTPSIYYDGKKPIYKLNIVKFLFLY